MPAGADLARAKNPIDNFIQDRLRRDGMAPAHLADARTQLRRVTLDLTGVPPTPDEMRAFLADNATNAYEKAVDRLLASPRYATMHWLDAVRYADTSGFHGDNPIPAWPYRDYVLRTFADNKSFDEFTREQIAGDLLPNATLEQRGMLDDTLVIWGGEFGRTPMSQRNGRDHHIKGFSFMLAGGGIKNGLAYGATDDLGYAAVDHPQRARFPRDDAVSAGH